MLDSKMDKLQDQAERSGDARSFMEERGANSARDERTMRWMEWRVHQSEPLGSVGERKNTLVEQPITDRQIRVLRQLGINRIEGLNRREAARRVRDEMLRRTRIMLRKRRRSRSRGRSNSRRVTGMGRMM